MTHRESILRALRVAGRPLDDDELARMTGIAPRQTVNQVCRGLVVEGLLERCSGPDGKLVNSLRDELEVVARAGVALVPAAPALSVPPGDSTEQRGAEREMLDALGARLGIELNPRRLTWPGGVVTDIDGVAADLSVLAECWAHQGPAKVAQKYKLVNDATKLHWAGSMVDSVPRKLLCVSDEAAVAHLRGRSWQAAAIRDQGVEIVVVELAESTRAAIAAAQVRQFR